MKPRLVLASQSPFRKSLMEQIGLDFITAKPLINEELLKDQLKVDDKNLAQHLAKAKAESLITTYPQSIIIGSDQVLILNNEVLNKPKTQNEVHQRLQQLQGKTHQLHTAIAVYYQKKWTQETIIAELEMKNLTSDQIEKYAQLDQTIGCAGGYKIESHGPLLFSSIKTSDHYSIVGLPLLSLTRILDKIGNSPL